MAAPRAAERTASSDVAADRPPGVPPGSPEPAPSHRWIDAFPGWMVNAATVLGFALPVAAFLASIARYGVDVVYSDQLSVAPFLAASRTHLIPWGPLWAQYNQDRSFFPNLVVVALAHLDHFDVRVEDLIGGLMLIAATGLLVVAHKRRSPRCPWLYYCPVPFVTLSVVQYSNTFFGGVSWYLTMLGLAAALVLLDADTHRPLAFGGAVAAAVVGTFSSAAGLFIWPAALVLLVLRRRSRRASFAWVGCAAVTVIAYFHGFVFDAASSPQTGQVFAHPWTALQILLTTGGNVFGLVVPPAAGPDATVLLLGVAVLTVAVWAVARNLTNGRTEDGGPLGVALITFALLFALSVTAGRIEFGQSGASVSRYTTYSLLFLVGSYLGFLGVRRSTVRSGASRHPVSASIGTVAVLVLMGLQVPVGTVNGLRGERQFHEAQVVAGAYERIYRSAPDFALQVNLGPFRTPAWIRGNLSTGAAMHLSVFSRTAPVRGGPLDLPPPPTGILIPRDGAVVHGPTVFDAGTLNPVGVAGVSLTVRGDTSGLHDSVPMVLGGYGWVARWDTTKVPDGAYTAVATTTMFNGRSTMSRPVPFVVANG